MEKEYTKLAVFDFDGTIWKGASWWYLLNYVTSHMSELNSEQEASLRKKLEESRRYRNKLALGNLTKEEYNKWAKSDASIFSNLNIKSLNLTSNLKYTPGFFEFVEWLKSNGFYVGVVSAGVKFFIDEANENLKKRTGYTFDFIKANELIIKNNSLTGEVVTNVYPYNWKTSNIKGILNQNKNHINKKLYLGDELELGLVPSLLELDFLIGIITNKVSVSKDHHILYRKDFFELKNELEHLL